MCVARNILYQAKLVHGGGKFEMEVSAQIINYWKKLKV